MSLRWRLGFYDTETVVFRMELLALLPYTYNKFRAPPRNVLDNSSGLWPFLVLAKLIVTGIPSVSNIPNMQFRVLARVSGLGFRGHQGS